MANPKAAKKTDVTLYALSTCVWCRKTKALLDELGVKYRAVDVDLLEGAERESARKEMSAWNPRTSFPTLVFGNEKCIVGFDEQAIRGLFK